MPRSGYAKRKKKRLFVCSRECKMCPLGKVTYRWQINLGQSPVAENSQSSDTGGISATIDKGVPKNLEFWIAFEWQNVSSWTSISSFPGKSPQKSVYCCSGVYFIPAFRPLLMFVLGVQHVEVRMRQQLRARQALVWIHHETALQVHTTRPRN